MAERPIGEIEVELLFLLAWATDNQGAGDFQLLHLVESQDRAITSEVVLNATESLKKIGFIEEHTNDQIKVQNITPNGRKFLVGWAREISEIGRFKDKIPAKTPQPIYKPGLPVSDFWMASSLTTYETDSAAPAPDENPVTSATASMPCTKCEYRIVPPQPFFFVHPYPA